MRHKPTREYSGVTVVLSNPSRHDNYRLIDGTAGFFFETECLPVHRSTLDIRTADTFSEGLLPGTKGILLLGDKSFQTWASEKYSEYTLSEQRGTPLESRYKDVLCIASYSPQDAIDIVDHESRLNPLAKHEDGEEYDSDDEDEDVYSTKKKGATRRGNYRFWLKFDTRKLFRGINENHSSVLRNLETRIMPKSSEIISFFENVRQGENLYLDIETSIDGGYNIFCIGVSTDESPVYVFPVFDHNFRPFYSDLHLVFKAFALAMERATTVCHNGYAFDLPVLAWRYHIPIGLNHYDTLIAQHRCFPQVEKSLGHCLSLWTYEPYHKDEGIFTPHDFSQYRQLLEYNAKDVGGMRLVKWAIDKYAKSVPGQAESIFQGNKCVYPYVLCSLYGMPFDNSRRKAIMHENDRLMTQYLRMLKIFTSHLKYDGNLLPTSPKSCVRFFHDFMNYAVVARSRSISKKTGKPLNSPSLNEKAFWKLKLKYPDNAIIDICVKYRQVKKESGMLKFEPWNFYALPDAKTEESTEGSEIILEGPEGMED